MDNFKSYAEQRLKEHEAELNTRYWNEQIPKQEKEKALENHVNLFRKELEEKVSKGNEANAKNAIEEYVSRLKQAVSKE